MDSASDNPWYFSLWAAVGLCLLCVYGVLTVAQKRQDGTWLSLRDFLHGVIDDPASTALLVVVVGAPIAMVVYLVGMTVGAFLDP